MADLGRPIAFFPASSVVHRRLKQINNRALSFSFLSFPFPTLNTTFSLINPTVSP